MWAAERTIVAVAGTLGCYHIALWMRRRMGLQLLHPSLIALPLLLGLLVLLKFPVGEYQVSGRFLTFLVGPATVGLAVPVYKHRRLIRAQWPVVLGGILAGGFIGVVSAVAAAAALGLSRNLLLSVAPKSVTAPVALRLSEQIGGIPALTMVVVQITGILGSMLGPMVLRTLRIQSKLAWGIALGTAAHAGGTERALHAGELEGAVSSLALAFNAAFGPLLIPPLVRILVAVGDRWGMIPH